MIGSVLGNYRIAQKLGQGGVGEVWKATDLTLDREVALKILRPELAAVPEVVARFRTEALALARLNHPNVATIHGFHSEGGTPFIVMELIPGQTLDALVRGFGPMRGTRALPLFSQACGAVQHAHEHGLVHRDLKASNVMLSQAGVVKMLDFGIARVAGSAHLTQGTHSIGTPAWMAPEQIRGEEADVRTDVYALGLLLYWLVTARLPFEARSHYELQRAHVEEAPPSPRQFASDLSEPLEKAILRALAKRRSERFASVGELRIALGEGMAPALTVPMRFATVEETLGYEPHPAPGPTLVLPRDDQAETRAPAPVRSTGSRWLALGAGALLALAVAAGVHMARQKTGVEPVHPLVAAPASEPAPGGRAAVTPSPRETPAPRASSRERKASHKPTPSEDRSVDGWVIRRR